MDRRHSFKTGWLEQELRAAVKEAGRWPAEVRRSTSVVNKSQVQSSSVKKDPVRQPKKNRPK